MRAIDADALKDHLQNLAYDDWNQGVSTSWADAYRECADMVDEQPTIEPEIIRCKDCIYGRCDVWLSGNGSAMGYGCCERTKSPILPNDFCSRAERREEGDG